MTLPERKPRILLVVAVYTPAYSGAGHMGELLRDSSVAREFDLQHLNVCFSNSFAEIEAVQPRKLLLLATYLWRFVLKLAVWRPDIVLLCPSFGRAAFAKDACFTMLAAWVFRRRVVWWVHPTGMDRLYANSGRLGRSLIRWACSHVHRTVTVGDAQKHEFKGLVAPHRVVTIHNGVRAEAYPPKHSHGHGDVRVVFISNLELTKGWRYLLEAAVSICRRRGNVSFRFYGNPGRDAPLDLIEAAFADAGRAGPIQYCGPAYGEAKHAALEAADIFCVPTFLDSFGLVNLEAMNARLPIVSTNYSSIPEAVIDGQGGLLVPTRDAASLVAALEVLIDDPALRRRMGDYNYKRFCEHFTETAFADRWIGMLREAYGSQ